MTAALLALAALLLLGSAALVRFLWIEATHEPDMGSVTAGWLRQHEQDR